MAASITAPELEAATMLDNYKISFDTDLIPIPQQHLGNCASDTIQIIMFYADGFYDYFVKKIAKKWIRQGKPAPLTFSTPLNEYLHTALIRFVNIHTQKHVVRETPTLSRSRSCNDIPFAVPCSGIKCSGWVAKYINPVVPLTSGNKIVSSAWAYLPLPYAQFTKNIQ